MTSYVGRYEIRAELGRGGFGRVFRAFDPSVRRMVAVKILESYGDAELLIRFRNEAAAAGKLRHKNIVTIHDFGEDDGVPYLVMELIEGADLQRLIRGGEPMTLLAKVEVMSQIAKGLHHAHVNGVLHRDVKPANIMRLPDGSVKIMDFGIAQLMHAAASRVTPQGSIIGTFRYMAPEQFQGSPPDARFDIFSYGVTSFELLTGKHPFDSPEPPALMYNIMNAPPAALKLLCPDAPPSLEQVLLRSLEKQPELRYQSLEELEFDLAPILLDLRKKLAANLVVETQQLIRADRLDLALNLIREILDVDPANQAARSLREERQQAVQRRIVRARVEELVSAGRQQLITRNFSEALDLFDSASRLGPTDSDILALAGQARSMLQKTESVKQLLNGARKAMLLGDLTGAYQSAALATRTDEHSSEAALLLATISEEIGSRERRRRLRDGVSRVKGKLLLQAFDDAFALLTELQQEDSGSAELAALIARAEAERAAYQRRQLLVAHVAAAREFISERRFGAAIGRLEEAKRHFLDSTEISSLLSYAQEEYLAEQHAADLDRIAPKAGSLSEPGETDQALELVDGTAASLPVRVEELETTSIFDCPLEVSGPALSECPVETSSPASDSLRVEKFAKEQAVADTQLNGPSLTSTDAFRLPDPCVANPGGAKTTNDMHSLKRTPELPHERRPMANWFLDNGPVSIATMAGVGIVLLSFWWWHLRDASALMAVEVQTKPEGATVKVNGLSCRTPNCRLYLPSGRFVMDAELEGYRPSQQWIEVARGPKAPTRVYLALQQNPHPHFVAPGANTEQRSVEAIPQRKQSQGRTDQKVEQVPSSEHATIQQLTPSVSVSQQSSSPAKSSSEHLSEQTKQLAQNKAESDVPTLPIIVPTGPPLDAGPPDVKALPDPISRTVLAPPAQPKVIKKLMVGTDVWEGELRHDARVTIYGTHVDIGMYKGKMLGKKIRITRLQPGVLKIVEAPSPANSWNKLVLVNSGSKRNFLALIEWEEVE